MYCHLISFLTFITVISSAKSDYHCDFPSFYDFPTLEDYPTVDVFYLPKPEPPPVTKKPPVIVRIHARPPVISSKVPPTTTTLRSTQVNKNSKPSVASPAPATVISRFGQDLNSVQQTQSKELYCLEVLGDLIATQWQADIDRISVNDLGNFSTMINVPPFKALYSNPESEWIQDEGRPLHKLDRCVRNLVSRVSPRMDQDEIECLNKMYPDYLSRENKTAMLTKKYIEETSKDQLPFRSFHTYFELTELLFDNKNIDALDDELRAIHEDMLDFYIKTEDDKNKKIFILEQECEWKDARALRETHSEDARYEKFAQLVKSHVNTYLTAEILQKWIPGAIIPEYRYNVWRKARKAMDDDIVNKIRMLRREKRDAQYLCTYAAELATNYFMNQKAILFEKMTDISISFNLKTYKKYAYVAALEDVLKVKNDERLSLVKPLVDEFKNGHYCLVNFVRMIENHQRYTVASSFIDEMIPYAHAYCLIKEMSAGLINPRYCKCQGTFCEQFGLATVRAERFNLVRLPNNTYTISPNSSYRIRPLDELIQNANMQIAQQKFNTWWYRHQKVPV